MARWDTNRAYVTKIGKPRGYATLPY